MVGALLECHFKEKAIFKLFFARSFLQCLCGVSGGSSVSTQRELPAEVFSSREALE